jgi:hypothetical protein
LPDDAPFVAAGRAQSRGVVYPRLGLLVRSGDPDVSDAQVGQLRGKIRVRGPGHQPSHQILGLLARGQRTTEGTATVGVAQPDLIVGDH